eukprot:1156272-Pelagomonas_calceolata.AAC.3
MECMRLLKKVRSTGAAHDGRGGGGLQHGRDLAVGTRVTRVRREKGLAVGTLAQAKRGNENT